MSNIVQILQNYTDVALNTADIKNLGPFFS